MANQYIIPFLQSLSDVELRVAEDYLQKNQPLFSDGKTTESKELSLFRYIVQNKDKKIGDNEILEKVDIKDLSHLKVHLYNKVIESLTFDKYISNDSVFNENDIASFRVKKLLLFFKIQFRVMNKGKIHAMNELLNDIIEMAKGSEVYDGLTEALLFKKYQVSFRQG